MKSGHQIASHLAQSSANLHINIHSENVHFEEKLPPLLALICEGDIQRVKTYLANHPGELESQCDASHGATPLMYALAINNSEMTEILLQHGASLKTKDKAGNTPLHYACIASNLALIQKIYASFSSEKERAAALKEKNSLDRRVLHLAAMRGDLPLFTWLVQAGASLDDRALINKKDDKTTPFGFAIAKGGKEIVEYCLSIRPRLLNQAMTHYNTTPVQWTAYCGQLAILQWLYERGGNIATLDNDHSSIMQYAVISNSLEVTKWVAEKLREKKIPLNRKDKNQVTPLLCALKNDNTELFNFLLDNGGSLTERHKRYTLFMIAIIKEKMNIAKLIYQKNPQVLEDKSIPDKKNPQTDSVLGVAIKVNSLPFVQWLLEEGASLESDCINGLTPLGVAVTLGHFKIADFLFEKGASIYCDVKHQDRSLLFYLSTSNHLNVKSGMFWLLSRGAAIGFPHHALPGRINFFTHQWLLEHREDVRQATANQIVIGLTVNGEKVTRRHLGFENAITNINELKEVLADDIHKLNILAHIDDLLKACDYALEINTDDETVSELAQLKTILLKEKQLKNNEQLNQTLIKKQRKDFDLVLNPRSKPLMEKRPPQTVPVLSKNRRKKLERTVSAPPDPAKQFESEVSLYKASLIKYGASLQAINQEVDRIEGDKKVQEGIGLAKDSLITHEADAAANHANTLLRKYSLIEKTRAACNALLLNLVMLQDKLGSAYK